jgi:hypothetical protein
MARHVTLAGPVELIDEECVLRIPLAAGGAHFVECLRGIGQIQDEHLLMPIDDSVGFTVGRIVEITNRRGRFSVRPYVPRSKAREPDQSASVAKWRAVPHKLSWSIGWASWGHEWFVEFGRS